MDYGAICGAAILYDIVPVTPRLRNSMPWAYGPYCWLLEEIFGIEPVPCVGQLGLFAIPDDVRKIVQKRLPAKYH